MKKNENLVCVLCDSTKKNSYPEKNKLLWDAREHEVEAGCIANEPGVPSFLDSTLHNFVAMCEQLILTPWKKKRQKSNPKQCLHAVVVCTHVYVVINKC